MKGKILIAATVLGIRVAAAGYQRWQFTTFARYPTGTLVIALFPGPSARSAMKGAPSALVVIL